MWTENVGVGEEWKNKIHQQINNLKQQKKQKLIKEVKRKQIVKSGAGGENIERKK